MLPGARGLSPIPRNMAGMAMITIDESRVAMNDPSEVFVNATHL